MTSPSVSDQMVRTPLVRSRSTTVEQARAFFESDHVHLLLLTATGRVGEPLLGTVVRADLPASDGSGTEALDHARLAGRTVHVDAPLEEAREALAALGGRRLAVVDDDFVLRGLLCLKRDGSGFCSDADVASRRDARDEARMADEGHARPESGPPGGLVEVLTHWEDSGGRWAVLGSTAEWIDVALLSADGAEQVSRVSSARTSVLRGFLGGRTSSTDPRTE